MTEHEDDLLSMDEAIELLKTTRPTFYRWLRSGKIQGMKVGRQWRFYPAEIDRFLKGEPPKIELPVTIEPLIAHLENQLGQEEGPKSQGAARAADLILLLAASQKGTDIHIEAIYGLDEKQSVAIVRLRVDGQLKTLASFDRRLLSPILGVLKGYNGCALDEQTLTQQGQFRYEYQDTIYEIRSHFMNTRMGESATLRLMNQSFQQSVTLDQLAFTPHVHDAIEKVLENPWGMILANGPTGCGKTTTLYAMLNQLARPEIKTVGIEEHTEMAFPWVSSVQVQPEQGFGYLEALKSTLNSDPDVVMVGEIQNPEVMKKVQEVALTGHLVLSLMHAPDSVSALIRMLEVSGNPYTVSESVKLIVTQRLVRRLCKGCSFKTELTQAQKNELTALLSPWGKTLELNHNYGSKGCEKCQGMGYRGRTLIAEALEINGKVRQLIMMGRPETHFRESLSVWPTLLEDGLAKVDEGITSVEEVFRVMGMTSAQAVY